MQNTVDFVNSACNNYHIDSLIIQNIQACLNVQWKADKWISLLSSNRECIVLKFNIGVFINHGFMVNNEKVLKVLGKHQIGNNSNNDGVTTKGIVDLDHGSRFEGLVLTENEGKVINGILFDNGTSYHNNGLIEYEGYWYDNKRFGNGKVYV